MPHRDIPGHIKDGKLSGLGLEFTPDGTRLHGEIVGMSQYAGQNQPPINVRLQQIRNFLTDDDIFRDPEFKPKLEECRKYIRDLKFGKQAGKDFNTSLVMNLELKIAVHDKWIREKEKEAEVDFDVEMAEAPPPPARLLPFTYQPPAGATSEQLGHKATAVASGWPLGQPESRIHVPDEPESSSPFRSTPSGPVSGSSGASDQDDFKLDPEDPWKYTKAAQRVNNEISAHAITRIEQADKTWNRNGKEITPYMWNPMPTDFLKSFSPPSADQLHASWHETYERLASLLKLLVQVQARAPRPLLNAICNTIVQKNDQWDREEMRAVSAQNPERFENKYLCLGDFNEQEYEDLKIFTYDAGINKGRKWNLKREAGAFVQRLEELMDSDWWPKAAGAEVPAELVYRKIESNHPDWEVGREWGYNYLGMMAEDNRIQMRLGEFSPDGSNHWMETWISKPLPSNFPEDRHNLPKDFVHWCKVAERILRAYRILKRNMRQIDTNPLYMRDTVLPDFTENLRARIRLWEYKVGYQALALKWIELARPLERKEKRDSLGLPRARKLLQQRLMDEANVVRDLGQKQKPKYVWNWQENNWYADIGRRFDQRRWDYDVQGSGESQRYQNALDLAAQNRADANRGVKSVRIVEDAMDDDMSFYDSDMEQEIPSAPNNYYPAKEAFFPLPETEEVDRVMQKAFDANVPFTMREHARDAVEGLTRKNTRRNKRKAEDDEQLPGGDRRKAIRIASGGRLPGPKGTPPKKTTDLETGLYGTSGKDPEKEQLDGGKKSSDWVNKQQGTG